MLHLIKLYDPFVPFSFSLTNVYTYEKLLKWQNFIIIKQNWGSLYIFQYFNVHWTAVHVTELRHILKWFIFLAFNFPFFFFFHSLFIADFLGFQWKKSKFARCWALFLDAQYSELLIQTVGVGMLSCKEKMHPAKLSLSEIDYYIGCLYSLEGMWYASNPELMAVEMEPIRVQAVICLYKLIGFIVY